MKLGGCCICHSPINNCHWYCTANRSTRTHLVEQIKAQKIMWLTACDKNIHTFFAGIKVIFNLTRMYTQEREHSITLNLFFGGSFFSLSLSFFSWRFMLLHSQCITVLRIHAVAGIFLPRHRKNFHSQLISQWFWEPLVHAIHIYRESTRSACISHLINRSLYQTSSSVKRENDIFSSTSVSITEYFTGGSLSSTGSLLYFSLAWWHKPH